MNTTNQKYTLSLPSEIYDDLRLIAEKHDTSIKDVVRQCLKFGLIAIKIDEDPDAAIFFRKQIKKGDKDFEYKDTQVKFML
jgi:hypothetical protein